MYLYDFEDYEALFDLIDYTRVYPEVFAKIIRHYKIKDIETLYKICKGKFPKKDRIVTSNIDSHIGRALDLFLYPKKEIILPVAKFYGEKLKKSLESKEDYVVKFTKGLLRGEPTLSSIDLILSSSSLSQLEEDIKRFYLFEEFIRKENDFISFRSKRGHIFNVYITSPSAFGYLFFLYSFKDEVLNYLKSLFPHYIFTKEGISSQGKSFCFSSESEVFDFLDMQFIPYELRWDKESVDKALSHDIPPLVKLSDIKGDFHIHTFFSDGEGFIKDIVHEAKDLDYEYVAITEHSRSQKSGNGIGVEDWKVEADFIQRANEELYPFRIFKGLEVDILKDGALDFPYEVLREMDVVVLALHHPKDGTLDPNEKIAYGMRSGVGSILAHPKDRYWGKEFPFELDLSYLFENAIAYNVTLEISSIPDRIGFSAEEIKEGKRRGVKFAINSDAHAPGYLRNIDIGIIRARRGWLTKNDVINTYKYSRLVDEGIIVNKRK